MRNKIENNFTIKRVVKTTDLDYMEGLKIYNNTTPTEIKTATNEITHWLENSSKNYGFEVYIFTLYVNNKLVGLAMLTYIFKSKIILYEYIAFKNEYRVNTTFFVFVDLIETYFNELSLDISAFVVEINNKNNGNDIDKESKFFKQLICLQGFGMLNFNYQTLPIGTDNHESSFDAFLYIKMNDLKSNISKHTYLQIVESIYKDYTCTWFQPFLNREENEAYLNKAEIDLDNIKKKLSNKDTVDVLTTNCTLFDNSDMNHTIKNVPQNRETTIKKLFNNATIIVAPIVILILYISILKLLGIELKETHYVFALVVAVIPVLFKK